MLSLLRVSNFALAENCRVEFEAGLNIITGETGAGKSILVGALGLLLGGRADKSLIRTGENSCNTEAVFHISETKSLASIMEKYGLELGSDGELVIRRVLKNSGVSQNFVNDQSVTAQVLRELGEVLVDFHGPHDHQSLLNPQIQLEILDDYGHLQKARASYLAVFTEMRAIENHLTTLLANTADPAEQIAYNKQRLQEILEADIKIGEEAAIQSEHAVLGQVQRLQELGEIVSQALAEGDNSAFASFAGSHKAIEELSRLLPEGAGWRLEADELSRRIIALHTEIAGVVSGLENDPGRLEWLESRMALYQKLKRKYGSTVEDILKVAEEAKARLAELENRDEEVQNLRLQIDALRGQLMKLGQKLSEQRRAAANCLAKAIEKELKLLGIGRGDFSVAFQPIAEPNSSGLETVEFEFVPNVGEDPKPLRVIASSGEISRVMLAIKSVIADLDRVPVLVFDEIDANLGGVTGSAVGRKLGDLSKQHQVICITHLPQVAVFGQAHYSVEKKVKDGRTYSAVGRLAGEARVEEVARMLGGRDLTSVTLDHAREMLSGVQS